MIAFVIVFNPIVQNQHQKKQCNRKVEEAKKEKIRVSERENEKAKIGRRRAKRFDE